MEGVYRVTSAVDTFALSLCTSAVAILSEVTRDSVCGTLTTLQFQSVKATQNSHNCHTKFEFSMTIVVILYDIHILEFIASFRDKPIVGSR